PTSSSAQITVTQGGSPSGYLLYSAAAGGSTLDLANAADYCFHISAPYVIVRGIVCKGAAREGIRLETGAHDIVIEDSEISGWGRLRDATHGWGVNGDSGIDMAY